MPESPVKVGRDPLTEDAVAVSPSSLLPPQSEGPFFVRREEQLPEHGPSSLLPESAAGATRNATDDHVVAVSPSSLLPDGCPDIAQRCNITHAPSSKFDRCGTARPPKAAAGFLIEADVYSIEGKPVEAARFYRRAFELAPVLNTALRLHDALLRADRVEEADKHLLAWLEKDRRS